MSPDQINQKHGRAVYRCRWCHAESGLHWWAGTSCPVCANPECSARCAQEVREERERLQREAEDDGGVF